MSHSTQVPTVGAARQSLLYICEEWPNPYKPTWDAQIRSLMELGFEVSVVHCSRHYSEQYDSWRKEGDSLGLIPRWSYPTTLQTLPPRLLNVRFLARIFSRLRFARGILKQDKPLKERALDYARLCSLPHLKFDVVLVKNLNCAADYSWLPLIIQPESAAVYYHGGAVAGVEPWYLKHRRMIFENYSAFFTNTRFSKQELESLGCPPRKTHAIPVGLSIPEEHSSRTEYLRDGVLHLLSVSRLSEEKGVIYAIQALEKLIGEGLLNIRLDVIGNGLEEATLRAHVKSRKLDRWIGFHGHQANRVIRDTFLPRADVLINTCFPTRHWAETQCIAIQEAGLERVPAIASRCGGLPEVIVDGKTGILTEPRSVDSIAAAIRQMLSIGSSGIARMGVEAEEFTRCHFDVRIVTKRIVETIREPLAPA